MNEEINTQKFIHASLWTAINSYSFFIINFFGQIILARLLFPRDYGLYAFLLGAVEICVMFLGFSNTCAFINSSGTIGDFHASFKLNVIASAILCSAGLIGCFLSILITHQVTDGLFFLLLCIAQSFMLFAYVFMAPLQKSLEFKKVSFYNGLCSSVSLAMGILLAKLNFSFWSLALRDILNYLFLLMISYHVCSMRIQKNFLKSDHREQLSFGLKMTFSRALELLYFRFSDILIKFTSGKFILGNFYQARTISYYPIKLLEPLTHQVLFSFFSNIKHDKTLIANRLNWINIIVTRAFLPIIFFVILYGESLFIFIYGEKWALAGHYFKYFSFWMLIASLFAASTSTAYSLGKQWIPSFAYLIASLLFIVSMVFFHRFISPPLFFTISLAIGYVFSLMMLQKVGLSLKIKSTFLLPMLVLCFSLLFYYFLSTFFSIIVLIFLYGLLMLYEKKKVILVWKKIFT